MEIIPVSRYAGKTTRKRLKVKPNSIPCHIQTYMQAALPKHCTVVQFNLIKPEETEVIKPKFCAIVAGVTLTKLELVVLRLLPPQGERATVNELIARADSRNRPSHASMYGALIRLKRKGLVDCKGKQELVNETITRRAYWGAIVPLTWSDPEEPMH